MVYPRHARALGPNLDPNHGRECVYAFLQRNPAAGTRRRRPSAAARAPIPPEPSDLARRPRLDLDLIKPEPSDLDPTDQI